MSWGKTDGSSLLLVRHGQASAGSDDYDRLSDLGKHQSRVLGEYWAGRGLKLDRVLVGTLRRHRETAEAAGEAFTEAGGRWPEHEPLKAFNEHSGYQVVMTVLREMPNHDSRIAGWVKELASSETPDLGVFWKAYRHITRLWAAGELDLASNGHEPWSAFRSRVERGLQATSESVRPGEQVAIFTSGGPSGVAAATALGLDNVQTMELSWRVQNSAVTELLPRGRDVRLKSFNSASHLRHADLVTMV